MSTPLPRFLTITDEERLGVGPKAQTRARRISARMYRMRLLIYLYNGIAWPLVIPHLREGPVFWVLWIGLHFVWPHLAYAISRGLSNPMRTERIAMICEAVIIGCVINEMGYAVWYVFSALAASFISSAAFGGGRLMGGAALGLVTGTLLWGALRGFTITTMPPLITELVGAIGGAIPLLVTTQANFRALSRLSQARRETERRNRQYQTMMEMSAVLRHSTDTARLIDLALSDFRRLMPEYGFGIVLREPQRHNVIRHADFQGVDRQSAEVIVQQLANGADREATGPIALRDDGDSFQLLPLTPHLQQLHGFIVICGDLGEGEETTMLRLFAEQVASSLESNLLTQRLDRLANTDALTGLHNRAYFHSQLELARRNRVGPAGSEFSVIMIDLNGLKAINDTYGHEAGDAMIQVAANLLSSAVRSCDVLARIGGDEFVILANDCGSENIQEIVARIQNSVQDQCVPTEVAGVERFEIRVSLSVGAASSDEADPAELLEVADRRMYENKQRFYERLRQQR